MRKAKIDLDATENIRQSPCSTPATLSTYTALRELATEAGTCEFTTSLRDIGSRALLSDTGARRALRLMERRRIIERRRDKNGVRVRLLRVG